MKVPANSACFKAIAKGHKKRTSREKISFQGDGGGLGRDMEERKCNQNTLKTVLSYQKYQLFINTNIKLLDQHSTSFPLSVFLL